MRPVTGLLLLGCLACAAQQALALPPIITVKNLRAKSGPAYKWKVESHVSSPFTGPVYPGKAGTARVTVDITRASITKGYVVTGKLIVTNPLQNSQALSVTGLKASFGPVVPLLTPLPQQLECPQETLQPGQSLSCSFRVELSSSAANTLTPIVLIKGLPQLQGEPMALTWPSDEDHQLPNGKVVDQESSCALIQMQVAAGDLQPVVRVSTGKEYEDMLQAGLEVCEERAMLAYDVTVGPLDAGAGLCGSYVITDVPVVRLAAGSIGSSSTSRTSLPVTIGGCRQKDVLGGHKPSIDITRLTLAKVITHEWAARPIASTNTSSPAAVKYDAEHAVDVAVHMQRTDGNVELVLSGQMTITNTELLPYILPAQGVRLALSKGGASPSDAKHISVSCPMVGNNIVIGPALDGTPGRLVCEFRKTVEAAWTKGFIQAQLQTLLSAKHEVDSGEPRAYDFDDRTAVQVMSQGECVAVNVMRVTNPVDIMSANQNPAVASLARDMGGDKFKLVPRGRVMSGRIPPAASSQAEPMVVCGNKTVAWRESYGPFTEYDCGPNMALMGLSARPTTGPGDAVTATLAFPMAVKSCMLKPEVKPSQMRAYREETYAWGVHQSRDPKGALVTTNKQKALPVEYKVAYKRTASLGGFKVTGLFKVVNTHAATLNLDEISYSISRPTGAPITGEASCSGTLEDYADDTAEAAGQQRAQTSGGVDASGASASLQPQTVQPGSSSSSSSGSKPAAAKKLGKRIRMAAVKYVKVKRQAKGMAVASAVTYEDIEEPEYEEGGNGPLFCSFEAHLPDDYPSKVSLTVVTDDGAKVAEQLGVIDWDSAETTKGNKCAMASFAFSTESSALVKPASIHGDAPPALAVKICEPKTYSFTAKFGPWSGPSCCGPKQAVSVATISLPQSATVISDEEKLHIDVTGCQQALPTLSIEASQHPVKGSFVWSVVRRMMPLGPHRKHPDPAVTVAGPGSPHPEPAVLMLSAKHAAGSKPGSYSKFNQTITVKRTTPSYEGKEHRFEVKGEVKLVHNGDKPLHLQEVQVKIACDGAGDGKHKPVTVTAICPDHCYDSDYSSAAGKAQTYLTIPTTASAANPVKCHFGAVVPGPASVSVHAVAVMDDGRKAKAKHSVHLDLRADDFFKPSTLGSCIRVREAQQVRDLLTGADVDAVTTQGSGIPEDWTEVCKTRTWSTVTRIGPLESYEEGCQAVSYESNVEAVPSSGYQTALRSSGVVEVHTKSCRKEDEEVSSNGSEDHKKPYKGGDYSKPKGGPHQEIEGSTYKGAENDEDFWGDMLPKQQQPNKNKKKKDSSSYDGEEDDEPSKGYKEPMHKGEKDTTQGYAKKPHQKDTYKKEDTTYGGMKDDYSGSKNTPPSDNYSSGGGSKAGEGEGDEDEGEGYDGPEELPTGGGGGTSGRAHGGGGAFPPLPGPINIPIPPLPHSNTGTPPLPSLPGNSGSSGGSNAPREGVAVPAPDSSSATPSPGGVWLPGLDGGSGASSRGSSVEDEFDGEGTGEGFDDQQPAHFWKGASKSKAAIPGLRGTEKLVTMTTSSVQKQQQHQQAADMLSPGFWSQLAKEAQPLVAQLAAQGQHKPPAVRPTAAKPAAGAAASVAAAAAAKPAQQAAASVSAAASKHAAGQASVSVAATAGTAAVPAAAAPSKPAAAPAAQASVSTAAAPAAAAAAGTPAAVHAAPAAAPAAGKAQVAGAVKAQ